MNQIIVKFTSYYLGLVVECLTGRREKNYALNFKKGDGKT